MQRAEEKTSHPSCQEIHISGFAPEEGLLYSPRSPLAVAHTPQGAVSSAERLGELRIKTDFQRTKSDLTIQVIQTSRGKQIEEVFVRRGWQGGCGGNCLWEGLWECAPLLWRWGFQQVPCPCLVNCFSFSPVLVWDGASKFQLCRETPLIAIISRVLICEFT